VSHSHPPCFYQSGFLFWTKQDRFILSYFLPPVSSPSSSSSSSFFKIPSSELNISSSFVDLDLFFHFYQIYYNRCFILCWCWLFFIDLILFVWICCVWNIIRIYPSENPQTRLARTRLIRVTKLVRYGQLVSTRGLGWVEVLRPHRPNPARCPPLPPTQLQRHLQNDKTIPIISHTHKQEESCKTWPHIYIAFIYHQCHYSHDW
jgi:hypothetical protein